MVFQIECNDERGDHVEVRADGTIRLFAKQAFDVDTDKALIIGERQTTILKAMILAEAELQKVAR